MSGFPPKPGTAVYRVLAHLETILPRRPRATAGMIAGELRGLTPMQVRDALEAAHEAGYVNREAEISVGGRGPVFYELVRGTSGELAIGGASPDRDYVTGSGDPAHEPRGVIEPVVDPHPVALTAAAAAPEPAKVVSIKPMQYSPEADLERTPQLSDWLRATRGLPVAERDEPETVGLPAGGVLLDHKLSFDPGPVAAAASPGPEAVFPPGVQLDFAPGPDQFAVALASDGRLFCWRGTVPLVFTKEEARVLVQHLNRMDLDVLLDLEAGA